MALPVGKTFPYVPSIALIYWPVEELELASAAIVSVELCRRLRDSVGDTGNYSRGQTRGRDVRADYDDDARLEVGSARGRQNTAGALQVVTGQWTLSPVARTRIVAQPVRSK